MNYIIYRKRQITGGHKKLTRKESENLESIYNEISVSAGKYALLIKECTGLETIPIEIGRCQEIHPCRMIYLLEEGANFPTNINEKIWERFTEECKDKAFIKVAKEFHAFGLIKAMKH